MAEYVQSLTPKIHRSTSKSDSDNDRRAKREIANNNERRRMKYINMGFTQLRQLLVPNGSDGEKMSKATILSHAHERIRQLEMQNGAYRRDLDKRRQCSNCGQTIVPDESQDVQPAHLTTYPSGAIKLQYSGSKRVFPKTMESGQGYGNSVVYKVPNENHIILKSSPLSSPTQVESNASGVSYLIHAAKQLNQDESRSAVTSSNNNLQLQLSNGVSQHSLVLCQPKQTQRRSTIKTVQLRTHIEDQPNQSKKDTELEYPFSDKRPRVLPPKLQHKSQYKNESVVALHL